MRICVVTPRNSVGGRDLVRGIRALGAEVISAETNQAGCFNVGWGKAGRDLNSRLPANKLWELEACQRGGVRTVPFNRSHRALAGTMFGRLINHTKGRDIIQFDGGIGRPLGRRRAGASDFYTQVIPKHREYRIHVFDGLAVRSGTKQRENGQFTDNQPIWNMGHGFQIRYEHSAPRGARELAKAACAACGVDFAAVDVIEGTDGSFYFLELNCRPGLHGNTTTKYAEKIIAKARGVRNPA